jgi:hypothetical protein
METLRTVALGLVGLYLLGVDETTTGPLAGLLLVLYFSIWFIKKDYLHYGRN